MFPNPRNRDPIPAVRKEKRKCELPEWARRERRSRRGCATYSSGPGLVTCHGDGGVCRPINQQVE